MNSRHDKHNTKTTTLKPLARIGSWAQLRSEVPQKDKVPAKKGEGRGKALEKEKTTSLETEKRLGKEEKKQSKKDDKKEKPQAPRFPSSSHVSQVETDGPVVVEKNGENQPRLIVEALVVRKMSLDEAFLDFEGFILT